MAQLSDQVAPYIALAIGLWGLVGWFLVKLGRIRYWERWYMDLAAPIWLRHIAFVGLPAGIGFLFGALGGWLIQPTSPSSTSSFLGIWAVAIALLCFAWAGLIVLRPPQWVKPDWLLNERERRQAAGRPVDAVFVVVLIGVFLVSAAAVAVIGLAR